MQKQLNLSANKIVRGFTLLELLIALFIFTILSMILVGALHTVINALNGTEQSAERLRNLQRVLLMMSRDIEQTVNRPILDATGKEEVTFLGNARSFTFTHLGLANPDGTAMRSAMQRTRYYWADNTLWKSTWPVLDQAPQTKPHLRELLNNMEGVRFEYLASNNRFQNVWPIEGESKQALPKAVKVTLSITKWGNISQLYVIAAQASKADQAPPQQKSLPEQES